MSLARYESEALKEKLKNNTRYNPSLGVGFGAVVGIGIFSCALSAGIIATPFLVPAGLGIIAGSMIIGGIIGSTLPPPSKSTHTMPNLTHRVVPNIRGGRNVYGPLIT